MTFIVETVLSAPGCNDLWLLYKKETSHFRTSLSSAATIAVAMGICQEIKKPSPDDHELEV
jgi:hypothetical protein